MILRIQNLAYICLMIRSQDMEQNQILMPIKGHNFVANLQKMTHFNPNLDIVNENVSTKFGIIPSIRSHDIERKPNYYMPE